jgi:VIT1/CCC1 family predicted Fe2+/Mn2+ transporter
MRQNPPQHRSHRTGWLRAAVLGANDGIVSTASLVLGVAASGATTQSILIAGTAGLVAGAMSMGAGEYVSVSSQADTERADLELEKQHLSEDYVAEHVELATIYEQRGLEKELAARVAKQLMKYDALGAHARDELGISPASTAKPLQAASVSAISFSIGAALPLLMLTLLPPSIRSWGIAGCSLICLALLGFLAAGAGGAPVLKSVMRVTFWGALAMGLTSAIGSLFGVTA